MIEIGQEQVFLLSEGPRVIGVEKSYHTLYRYVTNGVPVCGSRSRRRVVKLESVQLPGGIATSVEAYTRFIQQLNKESSS